MRTCKGVFFVLLLLWIDNINVECKATVQEEAAGGGGSESWAEWATHKLARGLGFKADQDNSNANTHHLVGDKVADCVKDAAEDEGCGSAEEAKMKRVEEKVCDVGKKVAEEGKKTEDTGNWAKEKAKEGYESAKSKAQEAYEMGKDKNHHDQEL
ncbi:late embryogenesis abundant protein D-29 [Dorcoceras hygrometricum]|uniref:Late embryogenesis abundant protein D-29 n=1 Tax=Dorcoceras hygrometricum TaxID=472368 RepID=A0A2Z7DEM0_9LAMI|nr:late embryogenesis abundant protein D-29 [Dorcoceras hygrometricum]